jgi:UDP-N-acetylglucosamine 2-epimerase (non-hydrolysing)
MFFVPTEESAINLLFENIDPHKIFITGNTIVDACIRHLKIAERESNILSKLGVKGDLLTLTMHRAENVDDPERLKNIVEALLDLKNITVIFPVHPRTLKNLKKFGLYNKLESVSHIKLIKPIGYLDFLLLLSKSKVVMTDSGGLQEEAITLNVPCITLRYNTERPETVTAGGNILVGAEKEKILGSFNKICNDHVFYNKMKNAKNPFGDGNSSDKILKSILVAKKSDKLKISIPEKIVDHDGRELLKIDNNISVSQYEELNPGTKISMVFADNNPKFPHSELNLKNKIIIVNKFRIE